MYGVLSPWRTNVKTSKTGKILFVGRIGYYFDFIYLTHNQS